MPIPHCVRPAKPGVPFLWRGALPSAGLLALLAYSVGTFAHELESEVKNGVSRVLAAEKRPDVAVRVTGQRVLLSGLVADPAEGQRLGRAVRAATCDTWLGALPCAREVTLALTVAPNQPPAASPLPSPASEAAAPSAGQALAGEDPAPQAAIPAPSAAPVEPARWLPLQALRSAKGTVLRGEAPGPAARQALSEKLRQAAPDIQITDELEVSATPAVPGWTEAAERVATLIAHCTTGEVDLIEGVLSVDCQLPKSKLSDAQSLTSSDLGAVQVGTVRLVPLEDIKRCETAFALAMKQSQIRFKPGSEHFLGSSRLTLDLLAKEMSDCPGAFRIEGHTDASGTRDENITLSHQRADAVVRALTQRGIAADRLQAVGLGPDEPLTSNATARGRARNRRIEVHMASPSAPSKPAIAHHNDTEPATTDSAPGRTAAAE